MEATHLTLNLVDGNTIRFNQKVLQYISLLDTLFASGETEVEEDEDFQLEWPLWKLTKEIIKEQIRVVAAGALARSEVSNLKTRRQLAIVQLYDVYRMLRVMYHYDCVLMVDLLLEYIVARLLSLDTHTLTLMNPRLGKRPDEGLADAIDSAKTAINETFGVRHELLMLAFTYYIENFDILNQLESHYLPGVTSVVSCGNDHTAVITHKGVFFRGVGLYGELGIKVPLVSWARYRWRDLPKTTALPISVWCGDNHTMLLTTEGLWAFGSNEYGQLGLDQASKKIIDTPTRVANLPQVLVVGCGAQHSIIVTTEYVYGCGKNDHGQTGTNQKEKRVLLPYYININERIHSVACGDNFSLLLAQSGNLYHFGQSLTDPGIDIQTPTLVQMPNGTGTIRAIAAGARHALILTTKKEVFVWGDNSDSQLGIPLSSSSKVSKHPTLSNIIEIVAGGNWSFFIDKNGDVFGCGANQSNQLGMPQKKRSTKVDVPTRLTNIRNVISIACASDYSMIVTCEGLFRTALVTDGLIKEDIISDIISEKPPICNKRRLPLAIASSYHMMHCHLCGKSDNLLFNSVTRRLVCSKTCQTRYQQFRVCL